MSLSQILDKYSRNTSRTICASTFDTPLGKVAAAADDSHLHLISFVDSKNFEKKLEILAKEVDCKFIEQKNKILLKLDDELEEYFAGKLKKFTVPVKTFGSEFQKKVWEKLQELPYGSTQTYGELAKSLGRQASHARAVGAACGANTHFLVIPCHRLVGAASKGGFNSGVDRKEWLIDHEKKHAM